MRDLSTNFVTKQHSLYVHDLDSYCLGSMTVYGNLSRFISDVIIKSCSGNGIIL